MFKCQGQRESEQGDTEYLTVQRHIFSFSESFNTGLLAGVLSVRAYNTSVYV